MRCTSRSAAEIVAATTAALLCLSACAFEPGNPWGELELSASARFAPGPERLTDEGWLRTSNDYALELTTLTLSAERVALFARGATGERTTTLDPANPPPGYSLCHNGHCHADDGSLPTYAEIEASLGTGGGTAAVLPAIVAPVGDEPVALADEPRPLALGPCSGCTVLEPTDLVRAAVDLHELRFAARIHDLRTGERRRLPEGGVEVEATVSLELAVAEPLELRFDRDEPLGARLELALVIPPALFDAIDWVSLPALAAAPSPAPVELSGDTTVHEAIAASLREHPSLELRRSTVP